MTILLALAASLAVGASAFLGGVTSRRAAPLHVSALAQMIAIVFAIPVAALAHWERVTVTDAAWSLGSGAAAACALGLFYSAMSRGLISIVAPVTAVLGAAVPVSYAVGEGERPDALAAVGIVLALLAVAVVSASPGEGLTSSTTIVLGVAAGVCFGAFVICFSRVSDDAGLWPIALSRFASGFVLAGAVILFARQRLGELRAVLTPCVAIGACEVGGITALFLAVQRGPVSIAAVLYSLYPVTTVLLAVFILAERLSRKQLAGVTLALAAVILISAP